MKENSTKNGKYEYIEGNTWVGATWQGNKDFPFATGRICGVRVRQHPMGPEEEITINETLISWHTKKIY